MLWLRGRRPKEPSNWRVLVREAEKRVARWARGKSRLAESDAFDDRWSEYKLMFSRRQHAKCGYCEMFIAPDARGGDIDHYRPKAAITRLLDDPATWGDEVEGHNRRDPAKKRIAPPACAGKGYWWLAYDFDNYLLACSTCNEKWKGNLFPIEGDHSHAPTEASRASERPLLLDPYGDIDPSEHLQFDKIGLIAPRPASTIGWETIRTCHLGRETLRRSREAVAKQAWPLITRILAELGRVTIDEPRLRRALRPLLDLGASRKQHAGMVRILWAQRDTFGISWEQLRTLRATLKRASGRSC